MLYFYLQSKLFIFTLALRKSAYHKCIFRLSIFFFTFLFIWILCVESIFQPRIEVDTNIAENDKLELMGNFFSKNSPCFHALDVQSQCYLLLLYIDVVNQLGDYPSIINGHLYFHNQDYFINSLIKKAKFWNEHGTKIPSSTQKENFVNHAKQDIAFLFKKSKYCEDDVRKFIQYKDKSEIIFNEKPSTPPSNSSSLSSLKPYKKPGKGGPGAWLRNRLEYIEECRRARAYQEYLRQENQKKNS